MSWSPGWCGLLNPAPKGTPLPPTCHYARSLEIFPARLRQEPAGASELGWVVDGENLVLVVELVELGDDPEGTVCESGTWISL